MIYAILLVLALVAAMVALAARKPDTFRIARETMIQAPPDRIFALIEDFARWRDWSPWEGKDPALTRTYGPIPRGRGATYAWEGNKEVGSGRMEIVEATPPARLAIDLQFFKPFKARNVAEFTLAPEGGGTRDTSTRVTWAMTGPNLFIGKVMSLFVDMDKLVGKDFEKGLANLKALAERSAIEGGQTV